MSGLSETKESGPAGSKRDQERFQGGTSAQENLSTFGQQTVTVALNSTEEDISKTSRGKGLPKKLAVHADPLADLQRIAALKGFVPVDNSGDGNCMFHALSNQLHLKGICVSHEELRKSSVEFLRNNPRLPVCGTELSGFLDHDKYRSWDEYLEKMAKNGEWGDHLILVAVANVYGISIRVISHLSHDHERTISPECPVNSDKQLVVGHVSELHYVSLQSKPVADPTPPNLQPLVEFTNWAKLARLIMVGGKEALRRLFDSYHPPANLAADLRAVEVGILNALKARRVLNKKQWDLLFPDDDTELDSHNFDVTLLVTLLINICNLNPPSCGWLADPPPDNTSLGADITRIRILRNQCAHAVTTAIDTDSFFRKWQEVTDVLVRLGLSPDEVNDMHLDYDVEELVNTRDCFNKLKADIEIIVASIRQAQEEPQSLKGPQQAEQQSLVERLECVERKIDYLGISATTNEEISLEGLKASLVQMQGELQTVKERQAEQASLVPMAYSPVAQWMNNPPQGTANVALPELSASQHLQLQTALEQKLPPHSFEGQVSVAAGGSLTINAPVNQFNTYVLPPQPSESRNEDQPSTHAVAWL